MLGNDFAVEVEERMLQKIPLETIYPGARKAS
jgi:hypothetical protein